MSKQIENPNRSAVIEDLKRRIAYLEEQRESHQMRHTKLQQALTEQAALINQFHGAAQVLREFLNELESLEKELAADAPDTALVKE